MRRTTKTRPPRAGAAKAPHAAPERGVQQRIAVLAAENAFLRETIAELRKAEDARHEFLSVAAHELKTPLTSLRGFAQLVVRQIENDDALDRGRLREALTTVDQQSVKLARLVSQLLDVSRIETGRLELEPRLADVVGIVEGAVAAARVAAPQRIFSLRAPREAMAYVDPLRLEQVLTNLLDNAAKYSSAGGRIDVAVLRPRGGGVRITVADSGIGIPFEHRRRIFDRFYQAHAGQGPGGMGLGLYISRQLVTLHGGRLEVESRLRGGSRFIIELGGAAS